MIAEFLLGEEAGRASTVERAPIQARARAIQESVPGPGRPKRGLGPMPYPQPGKAVDGSRSN